MKRLMHLGLEPERSETARRRSEPFEGTGELLSNERLSLKVGNWLIVAFWVVVTPFLLLVVFGLISGLGSIGGPFVEVLKTVVQVILLSAIVVACLFVYFVPWFVAATRHHHPVAPIFVLNVFLGWTLIGWAVALAIAVGPVRKMEQ